MSEGVLINGKIENTFIIISKYKELVTGFFNDKYKVWAESKEQAESIFRKIKPNDVIINTYLEKNFTNAILL